MLLVARAARQVGRDEGDDQAGGIHDHVPRVSRQGQGSRPKGTEQFHDDDGPRDSERPPQARGRGSRRVGMIVRVATFRAARGVRVVVGVGHGLVNVGRGRGGLLQSGAAGRGAKGKCATCPHCTTRARRMIHPAPASYAVDHAGGVLCWDWVPGSHCDGQRILEGRARGTPRLQGHKPTGL